MARDLRRQRHENLEAMAKRALTHLLVEVLAGGSLTRMSRAAARRSKTWGGHEAPPIRPLNRYRFG
jgi:hypothetical protein